MHFKSILLVETAVLTLTAWGKEAANDSDFLNKLQEEIMPVLNLTKK